MSTRVWNLGQLAAIVLCGLLCFSFAAGGQEKPEKKDEPVALFKYTETFRSEVSETERDAANPNRKESGTYRVEIVMPISYFTPANIENTDLFGVRMGNLNLIFNPNQTLDGKSRRGIRIDYTEGDGTKTPKRITGKIRIRWTLSKIIMNIEGSIPELGSPAGSLYIEEEQGKFTETTVATVHYGKQAREFKVSIHGEVKRDKRENGDGTTTTVELSGEGKPLEGEGLGGNGIR